MKTALKVLGGLVGLLVLGCVAVWATMFRHPSPEEVCTNIITHGYGGGAAEPVSLAASRRRDALVVTVEDRAPLFDPADAPEPDLAADWSARPIGGVGWHLVRKLMDEVHHEPAGEGGNRVTLVKYLPDRSGTTQE